MAGVARRLAMLAALGICTCPAPAAADWLVTPFVGTAFSRETTLPTFGDFALASGEGAGRKLTLGGAATLLGASWLGLEAEVSHTPGFFSGDDPVDLADVVLTSRVTTLTGSVIVTLPLTVTRESLRPYLVGGLGLMQARSKHVGDLLPVDLNLLGLDVGAGAVGMVGARTGLRFDLRYLKAVSGADGPFARPGISRLSFWRASVGVVFRVD